MVKMILFKSSNTWFSSTYADTKWFSKRIYIDNNELQNTFRMPIFILPKKSLTDKCTCEIKYEYWD